MRETRFRVWDKRERTIRRVINLFANGHVYVDCQCNDAARLKYHRDKNKYNLPHYLSGKHIELMQFAGLKDKNGKEIYEGGILKVGEAMRGDAFLIRQCLPLTRTAWSYVERVGFWQGKKYHALGEKHTQVDISYDDILSFSEECEVIGNIYENPELLGGGEVTRAVCFQCGDMKWGAFNSCENCGSGPKSDDELMLSLMLTDHNLNADQLAYFGRSIKAGRPPVIPESEKVKLRPAVEEAKKLLGIKRPLIATADVVKRGTPVGSNRHWMHRSFKAIAVLLSFIAVYFLVSTLIYFVALYLNGGSVFSPMSWRIFIINVFANAMAGYLGVAAGHALLDNYLTPYPSRFVGVAFIVLLGLWFVPLTLIYVAGAVTFLAGVDLEGWPPEGELGEYLLGLVRAVVAVICAWVWLVKRHAAST